MQTNNTVPHANGNIVLVGMMGAGKTTVGRCLARQTGKTFIDSDDEIQKRTGVTIPHIFEVEGEAGFRKREASVILDLLQLNNIVLATGGGAVLSAESRAGMREHGTVIYLKGSVHELWVRTRHDRNRPLLQTADPRARLQELLIQRDPLYVDTAHWVVPTGRQNVQTLVSELIKKLGLAPLQVSEPCKP